VLFLRSETGRYRNHYERKTKKNAEVKEEREVLNGDNNTVACNSETMTNVKKASETPNLNKQNQYATPQNPSLIHSLTHSSLHSQPCLLQLSNSKLTTSSAPCWTK